MHLGKMGVIFMHLKHPGNDPAHNYYRSSEINVTSAHKREQLTAGWDKRFKSRMLYYYLLIAFSIHWA